MREDFPNGSSNQCAAFDISEAVEFLFALILSGLHSKTLPVVIAGFNTDVGPLYNIMSAAATLVMAPTVILTLVLQRHAVRGLTLGAVKG